MARIAARSVMRLVPSTASNIIVSLRLETMVKHKRSDLRYSQN
jgi:hypothetical protein